MVEEDNWTRGEGQYANLQRQTQLDAPVVSAVSPMALRALDKAEEPGKRSKAAQSAGDIDTAFFTKINFSSA